MRFSPITVKAKKEGHDDDRHHRVGHLEGHLVLVLARHGGVVALAPAEAKCGVDDQAVDDDRPITAAV
jgi:hypothetical protein